MSKTREMCFKSHLLFLQEQWVLHVKHPLRNKSNKLIPVKHALVGPDKRPQIPEAISRCFSVFAAALSGYGFAHPTAIQFDPGQLTCVWALPMTPKQAAQLQIEINSLTGLKKVTLQVGIAPGTLEGSDLPACPEHIVELVDYWMRRVRDRLKHIKVHAARGIIGESLYTMWGYALEMTDTQIDERRGYAWNSQSTLTTNEEHHNDSQEQAEIPADQT